MFDAQNPYLNSEYQVLRMKIRGAHNREKIHTVETMHT